MVKVLCRYYKTSKIDGSIYPDGFMIHVKHSHQIKKAFLAELDRREDELRRYTEFRLIEYLPENGRANF